MTSPGDALEFPTLTNGYTDPRQGSDFKLPGAQFCRDLGSGRTIGLLARHVLVCKRHSLPPFGRKGLRLISWKPFVALKSI